jgi:hypothetical protein
MVALFQPANLPAVQLPAPRIMTVGCVFAFALLTMIHNEGVVILLNENGYKSTTLLLHSGVLRYELLIDFSFVVCIDYGQSIKNIIFLTVQYASQSGVRCMKHMKMLCLQHTHAHPVHLFTRT